MGTALSAYSVGFSVWKDILNLVLMLMVKPQFLLGIVAGPEQDELQLYGWRNGARGCPARIRAHPRHHFTLRRQRSVPTGHAKPEERTTRSAGGYFLKRTWYPSGTTTDATPTALTLTRDTRTIALHTSAVPRESLSA